MKNDINLLKPKLKFSKPKKISKTKLKKKVWEAFSQYIRLRDCLKTTGTQESGKCYTCGYQYEFKHLQAGHFIPGRKNAYLYDEKQVHAQCMRCNLILKGNWVPYKKHMEEELGKVEVEEMINKKYETLRFKEYELEELLVAFTKKTEKLKEVV